MKRYVKNIAIIILMLLMCGSIILTMNCAKNNVQNSNSSFQNMQNNGTPPEMPNNDSNNSNSNNSNDNTSEPPAKPDSDDNNAPSGQMPDNNQSNQLDGGQKGTPPTMNNSTKTSISYKYYIVFGFECLIFSALMMYLIISKFNKKTFRETFSRKNKIIISILGIIIFTSLLTYLSGQITNKIFLNNNNTKQSNSIKQNSNQNNNNNSSVSYSASKEITDDDTLTSGSYESTNADENALLVDGENDINISNITVTKSGDSDGGDNTSFYGTNSGLLAKGGSNLTLNDITVTTNATGANGVFCYGGSATTNNSSSDETTVTISNSKITTTKDNSGGIMTTGGGIMNASNLTINTSGTSSAAIRTDRGGGTVTVDGGTYTTTGQGSPSIYSTANISVSNASLVAKASEGIVIEGKNSVSLDNVTLTDTNNKLNGNSTTYKNIFLYQSMSGDASDGTSEFTAKNSKITTNNGDLFYITNTTATINLTNNTIINNDNDGNFLRAQKDSWGNSGSNGGIVTLNMTNQNAARNIIIDSISTLDMTMKTNSYYEGTINKDNSAKSISLTLDKTSKIKLTGDSYITSLNNTDSSNSNIDFNGYKLYVNGKSIN